MEEVIKQLGEKIDNYQAKTATTEQLEAFKQEVQDLANKGVKQEDIEAFKTSINTIEESINKLKDGFGVVDGTETMEQQIKRAIQDNHESIKNVFKNKAGVVEIELKAVASVTTASGTNTSPPTVTGTQQAPLQNVNLRGVNVLGSTLILLLPPFLLNF